MKSDEANAKEKIYKAALELLGAGEDAQGITTRQIAAKAGVNLALVNYYYRSKENLLSEVVGRMMDGIIGPIIGDGEDAVSRLKCILTATADAAFAHRNICSIALTAELKRGCRNSCSMITPLLGEMFPEYSQKELDIVSLQLMLPFHHIVLEPELYGGMLGVDFTDKRERDQKISEMIACALKGV